MRKSFLSEDGAVALKKYSELRSFDLSGVALPPNLVELIASLDQLEKLDVNVLELEVTNLSANRVRDLDINKVPWKIFRDANIVGTNYQPLDASTWSVVPSGLIGPIRLTPVR